jgi:hypothetical protein
MTATENGAISLASTGSARVNLFFKTVRNTPETSLRKMLNESWAEDPIDTIVLIFHLRDCRGGKGEKAQFHSCLRWLIENHPEHLKALLSLISFYGSWKDLLVFFDSSMEEQMISFYTQQIWQDLARLKSGDKKSLGEISLAAKWAPTEGCHHDEKFKAAEKFARGLGVRKCDYRRTFLVPLRSHLRLVESEMCNKKWEEIDFSRVPSKAMKKYAKAFFKNCPERYQQFLLQVRSGAKKMNVGRLHPHEILAPYTNCYSLVADESVETQWVAYVDQIKKRWAAKGQDLHNALSIVDVSGSMSGTPIQVAVALGMLTAELNTGHFHQKWMTFSTTPVLETLRGDTLADKVRNMVKSHWDMTTDIQLAFDTILTAAQAFNVPPSEMPQTLFIYSDMQWNQACRSNDKSNFEEIERKYREAGYVRPKIVFWNLRGDTLDFPVAQDAPNCALVSGFSPDLLDLFLEGEEMSPFLIMRKAIDCDRYSQIREMAKTATC